MTSRDEMSVISLAQPRMDKKPQMVKPEVKEIRRNRLVESMASLRTEEKSDICITAGDRQIFAHKLVLEASSPFFAASIAESEDGNLTYEDIEPDTLEIVLDYMYLGELNKLTDVAEIRKVMELSLLMELQELFEYCAAILIESLNGKNFVTIWEIAIHFQHKEMLKKTHYYLFNHADELVNTEQFLESSVEQISDLVTYTNTKVSCFDKMFTAMISWIRHDLGEREPHMKPLFTLVKPPLLTKHYMKDMLEDAELMSCSEELFNCMNELGVAVFVFGPEFETRLKGSPPPVNCKNVKANYFCEYKIEDFYDATTNKIMKRIKPFCVMQQFDLHTMKWQPPKRICFAGFKGATMFQHGRIIYFIGGALDSVYAMFDVASNTIEYIECNTFNGRLDCGICAYRGFLYVIGGRISEGSLSSCFKVLPGDTPWKEVASLKYARSSPIVGTTSEYIYIVGGVLPGDKSARVIEYLYEREGQVEQGTIYIRNVPKNVSLFFIVSAEILYGFYIYNNDLIRIWYNSTTSNWHAKAYPAGPLTISSVYRIAPTPGGMSLLFASTTTKGLRLPTYTWQPDSGIWTKLPALVGKCELPELEPLPYVYTSGI